MERLLLSWNWNCRRGQTPPGWPHMSSRRPSPMRPVTGALNVCSRELGFTLSPGRPGQDSRAPGWTHRGKSSPTGQLVRADSAARFQRPGITVWPVKPRSHVGLAARDRGLGTRS